VKNHNKEKYDLEDSALDIFLTIHNANNRSVLQIHTRQERPDYLLVNSNQEFIGLEITHLFFDPKEAKMLLARSVDGFHGQECLDDLISTLNELIKQKENLYEKMVFSFPIELLIRNASPIFGITDFMRNKDAILKTHVLKRIWFLSRDGNNEWLLKDLLTL
jgi:hypothetical protein